jgi:regulator of CtrA degradation
MSRTKNLSRPIIESLYTEALVLADEVRAVFALAQDASAANISDRIKLAMSAEGLKTTTRMMHVLAWLLNQRAHYSGEMSQENLRKHGRLPADRSPREEDLELLEPATRELIMETVHLHRRIARLDMAWSEGFETRPDVHLMQEKLGRAILRH